MSPLILVDGPLSDIRTKVAEDLSNLYVGMLARGNVNTQPDTYVRMMSPAIDQLQPVVIECSWITQRRHAPMYSPVSQQVFKRYTAQRRMLDRLALGCGAICVQVVDPNSKLLDRWSSYDDIIPTIHVDTWDNRFIQDIQYELSKRTNPGPGIGRWTPRESVLLIGDQHGVTTQPYNVRRNIAFCSMSGAGCSEWLADQLEAAGFGEELFYWINARQPGTGGKLTDRDFLQELQPRATVALGEAAADWCYRADLPSEKVQHPQSWKRFHFKEQYPLIPILKGVYHEGSNHQQRGIRHPSPTADCH